MLGGTAVTDTLCSLGVDRAFPLLFPVERAACISHLVVNVARVRDMLCDIRSVSRNTRGDDALLNIINVWQRKMLRRGNVAKECCARRCCDSSADRRGDVVIPGRDVRNQRSENVERRTLADGLLYLHIRFYLVKRNVSRSLDHNLNVLCPRALCKLTKAYKLFYLANVACICKAARTAGITQRDSHIILAADVKYLVKILVERVFLARHAHPRKYQRAAA